MIEVALLLAVLAVPVAGLWFLWLVLTVGGFYGR